MIVVYLMDWYTNYLLKFNWENVDTRSQENPNIKYMAAFALQSGVSKKTFYPYSGPHLEEWSMFWWNLVNLKKSQNDQKPVNEENTENFQVKNNNIIFDSPISDDEEAPVNYIDWPDISSGNSLQNRHNYDQ